MVVLLFSIKAFKKGRTQQHRTKGQMFGSRLQLCASGASAEPESAAPHRDQRHPHTLKCQAQRRARELKPNRGCKDKTCFIVVVNLGVVCWKGQGSTLRQGALPRTFPNGCWEKTHADNAGTLLPPSIYCAVSSATSLPLSAYDILHPQGVDISVMMFLDVFGAKYAASFFVERIHNFSRIQFSH